jgi:hypothetical protein
VSSGHMGTVAEAVEAWLAGTAGGPESGAGHHGDAGDHDHKCGECGRH